MTKRTRYTATISHQSSNEVEKRVILAYDAQSVVDHYSRLGYLVLSVEEGDYRRQVA